MSALFGTLCSGSGGNCAVFSAGGTTLLIDAGRSAKYICGALRGAGVDPASVGALFLTHSHIDHVAALAVLTAKLGVRVHAAAATAGCVSGKCAPGTLVGHSPLYSEDVGGAAVTSFATSHDTEVSLGYRVDFGGTGYGCVTDLGVFTDSVFDALRGCRAVILEANHDPGMLRCGCYPPELKRRIASDRGHLSNGDAAEAAVRLAEAGAEHILLAHISCENNRPELALAAVRGALERAGFPAVPFGSPAGGGRVALGAAPPDSPALAVI
jgi:phosphoribosyl 1,2-cyclic phosphodiesterase